jgi:hypothetical protein
VNDVRRNLFIRIALAGVVGAFSLSGDLDGLDPPLAAEWREVLGSMPIGGWVGPNDDILPSTDPRLARSRHETYAVEVERHVADDDWARFEARLPLGILIDDAALRRAGCNLARAVRADPGGGCWRPQVSPTIRRAGSRSR